MFSIRKFIPKIIRSYIRIIADADFDNETFCSDGIIVSCHKNNLDIPYTSLGNRQHTPLRMSMY